MNCRQRKKGGGCQRQPPSFVKSVRVHDAPGRFQLTGNGTLTLLEGWAPPVIQPARKAPLPPVPPVKQTAPVEREAPLADAALGAEDHPLLSGLNPEQQEAVTSTAPALAVIAGPGTGKTKTLVSRIAYLISERKVKPSEITAVTFTNKAAAEMRQRLEQALGGKRALRGMSIGTFHALCLEYLRETGGVTLLDAVSYTRLDVYKRQHRRP